MTSVSSPSVAAPFLAVAAALGLALSAGRDVVPVETALLDTGLLAGLAALVWVQARARSGERGAGAAVLALVLFAPVLGAVGGGGLPAALLLTAGFMLLIRALLDPTLQRSLGAGACLGLAVGLLQVEGAPRPATCATLAVGGAVLVAWRVRTAERCEPRRRVAQGGGMSALLAALVAALVLLGLDALPPFEPTEYACLWAAAAGEAAAPRTGLPPLLLLNGLSLLLLAGLQRPRRVSRYADGATLIALAATLVIGAGVPGLLPTLAAPWLALRAGAAVARAERPGVLRMAAVALLVQALSAVLLWPDYPRTGSGWTPLPVPARGIPA
jgi:hypothetical protein